ncbi:hypothetical protein R6Z07M_013615 [Ovis aries]
MVSPRHGPTDTSLCAAKAPQDSRLHRSRVGGRVSAGNPPGPGRAGPRCRRRHRRQLSILSPPPPPDGLSPSSRRPSHPPSLLPDSLRPGPPPGSAGPAPPPGTPADQPPPQGGPRPGPSPPPGPVRPGFHHRHRPPPCPAPAPELAPVQGKKFHPAPGRRERGGGGSGAERPGRGA